MIGRKTTYRIGLVAIVALLAADPAFAHHMMGGRTPSTFGEGLLSGLGHPVIGIDHLAFLVAIGVAVGVAGLNLLMPALFVAASAVGVALHVKGVDIPGAEVMVAASVILAGALVARSVASPAALWSALFVAGGLVHGYAFGESIFGAETAPLAAYLLGLVVIQSALAIGIAAVARRGHRRRRRRRAGAAVRAGRLTPQWRMGARTQPSAASPTTPAA
jgi:urease accessory protein